MVVIQTREGSLYEVSPRGVRSCHMHAVKRDISSAQDLVDRIPRIVALRNFMLVIRYHYFVAHSLDLSFKLQ